MHIYSAKSIVGFLNQSIDRVVTHLLPNGVRKRREWHVGSVQGEPGDSLRICLEGNKCGIWSDFATGESGDILNLWQACRNLSIAEAISEIKQWLGISAPIFEPKQQSDWLKPVFKQERLLQQNSPVSRYLIEERKLTFDTVSKYLIREEGNEIVFPYYVDGKLTLIKHLKLDRISGKKDIRVTSNCEPCLFGWHVVPKEARNLVLVEGEIDAMSLDQYNLGMAILSVPFGGGTGAKHKWLEYEFDRLAIFDEIYLCMDNDTAGQAAANELIERLGRHRCRIVLLPHKDVNICLQAGMQTEEIRKYFDNAHILDPVELKRASTYVEQVIEGFYPAANQPIGYSLPWDKARDKICFRPSELSLWTGYNGHGKSQLLGYALLHFIQQGARVCIASLELKPKQLLLRLTRQASGLRNPTIEYIKEIHRWYGEHLWIFDLVGSTKTTRLLEVFQYARQRYGIDVFVIDSLMKCGMAEDDYNAQKFFIDQLCDFKNLHNCHIHLVAHPRKGQDESRIPGKLDMKGSGSITDLADNCFTVFRNKSKEDEINKLGGRIIPSDEILDKYDCLLACSKQRNGEWEGKFTLWFNAESFQYLESRYHKPIQMVSYSCQPTVPME